MPKKSHKKKVTRPPVEDETAKLDKEIIRWNNDIMAYAKDVLGINRVWRKKGDLDNMKPGDRAIWTLQEEFLLACKRAILERKHIYIASGHSCGKDFIIPVGGLWFLNTYIPSLVIETAPTGRQVNEIIWKETKSHWENRKVDLGGRAFTEPRIEIDKDWELIGFSTKETTGSKEAGGAKFQGFKGKDSVCVLATEAQGIEDIIKDQIDAVTAGKNNLVVFYGNPTKTRGFFAKGLRDKEKGPGIPGGNIVFNFDCRQNPNYVERRTVIPGLASYQWVEERIQKWGIDDPRTIGRVFGKLPASGLYQVFSAATIEHAKSRYGFIAAHSFNRGVAWDPAGEGSDPHVFLAGSNGEPMEVFEKTLMGPKEGAIQAVEMTRKINGSWIIIECDGVGGPYYRALKELPPEYLGNIMIIPFYQSGASSKFEIKMEGGQEVKKPLYKNMRAEAAYTAKDRITRGAASINPNDTEMIADLQEDASIEDKTPLQILDKDDIRQSLQRSPGRGDAYKMFQWACEQNFKEIVYPRPGGQVQYGQSGDPVSGYQFQRNQPGYGVSE